MNLAGIAVFVEDRCVERSITVLFGMGNIVIGVVGQAGKGVLEQGESLVASRNVGHDDAESAIQDQDTMLRPGVLCYPEDAMPLAFSGRETWESRSARIRWG